MFRWFGLMNYSCCCQFVGFSSLVLSFFELIIEEGYKDQWEPIIWGWSEWERLCERFRILSRFRTSFDLRIAISPHSHNLFDWKFLWMTYTRLSSSNLTNQKSMRYEKEREREVLNTYSVFENFKSKMKILSKRNGNSNFMIYSSAMCVWRGQKRVCE